VASRTWSAAGRRQPRREFVRQHPPRRRRADSLGGAGGADTLEGGAGDDRLDGGSGSDSLAGGAGNDTYVISSGDRVVEEAGGGRDLVVSTSAYSLPDAVEWLELLGTARDGNGNALDNLLRGQRADNRLQGRGGADTLIGLGGADTLIGGRRRRPDRGGSGGDIILFNAPSECGDRLVDHAGTQDAIHVSARGFGGGLVAGMDLVATKRIVSRADGLSTAPAGTGQFVFETDVRLLRWDPDGRGGRRRS
jgi:serralysin